MTASLILFVLFIMFYIVISDIFTVFFRLTGLTEESARFQVISLLTNSGFTTRESEAVVASRLRRSLARSTMLFGYAFTVTIVSMTVNFFMTLGESELNSLAYLVPMLVAALVLFQLIRRTPFFKTRFDSWIEKLGNRIMFGDKSNPIVVVEDYGTMVAAHVQLREVPAILRDRPLARSPIMREHNILVMLVKNRAGEAQQARADTVLKPGDIIMVLGGLRDIRAVFGNT